MLSQHQVKLESFMSKSPASTLDKIPLSQVINPNYASLGTGLSLSGTPSATDLNPITSKGVYDATLKYATASITDVGTFQRFGNFVFFQADAKFGKDQTIGANTYVVLGDIPSGFTPVFTIQGGLCCLTNSQRMNLKANFTSTGKIQLYSGEATSVTTSWVLAPTVMWYTTDAFPS